MSANTSSLNSELYTFEYFLQDDVCRLCWSRDASRNIISTSQTEQTLKNDLLDKIRNCLELDFKDISYPDKVCNSCCLKIEEFSEFKSFCRETDRRLREIFPSFSIATIHEQPIFDVKIEKLDDDYCELQQDADLTKNTLLSQLDDFADCFNDSASTLSCQSLSDDEKLQKIKPVKRRRPRQKKPTYCNVCRLELETKENLASHNSQAHGIEEDTGLFKCFGCDKRFTTRNRRLGHEVNFCKGLKEGYKCVQCDRFLPNRRMYETHMRDHRDNVSIKLPEKIFQCVKCYEFFKTRTSLTEHMAEHDVDKQKCVCETCGRTFTRRDYLYKHMLTHTGTKKHVCPHCGARFTQRSSLVVHMRKHTGERPYACDVCPQRCTSSSNLRAHRRRHLGDKLYECTICDQKFGYKLSLSEHVSAKHGRARPYGCAHCSAQYSRARALRRHLRAKHDGETREPDKMASDEFAKMADDGGKDEEGKEVAFEVKAGEEFVILNENALVDHIYE